MTGGSRPFVLRLQISLAALAAVLVIVAGYLHTLNYPFHFDDFDWIRDNPALRPPLDLAAIWDFRPSRFVADLTFALNQVMTGASPASYRTTNLLIHWLAALLVGWIAAELARAARAGGVATHVAADHCCRRGTAVRGASARDPGRDLPHAAHHFARGAARAGVRCVLPPRA